VEQEDGVEWSKRTVLSGARARGCTRLVGFFSAYVPSDNCLCAILPAPICHPICTTLPILTHCFSTHYHMLPLPHTINPQTRARERKREREIEAAVVGVESQGRERCSRHLSHIRYVIAVSYMRYLIAVRSLKETC